MTTYIVTFDIADATRKNNLEAKLRQFDSYCPIHGSCWAVTSDKDPADIYKVLTEALAAPDRIFIVRSGTKAAWYTLGDENDKWLHERL